MTDFDSADYYDCDEGSEELTHTDPGDAIDSYLQAWCDGPGAVAFRALIAERAPLTVYAFHRDALPDPEWFDGQAALLAEEVAERWFDDGYGNAELEASFEPALSDAFAAALRATVKPEHVWACTQRGSREYSEADLLEMFKDELAEMEP